MIVMDTQMPSVVHDALPCLQWELHMNDLHVLLIAANVLEVDILDELRNLI